MKHVNSFLTRRQALAGAALAAGGCAVAIISPAEKATQQNASPSDESVDRIASDRAGLKNNLSAKRLADYLAADTMDLIDGVF